MKLDDQITEPDSTVKNVQYETMYHGPKSKFEHDTPNEFTSGNDMSRLEIFVIIIVLTLWVLSLRKFVKNFEKLRTTHYREIPYKYRLKDPENINHVKIVNNQNESVIYSRDPIKSLRSKSLAFEHDLSSPRCSLTLSDTKNNGNIIINESFLKPISAIRKEYSNSLNSINVKRIEQDQDFAYQNMNKNLLFSTPRYQNTDSNFLNPLYNLSPLIRQSLLDLHQKSVENLSGLSTPQRNKSSLKSKQQNQSQAHQNSVQFLESPV